MNKIIIFSCLFLSLNLLAQDEPNFETEFAESPMDSQEAVSGASMELTPPTVMEEPLAETTPPETVAAPEPTPEIDPLNRDVKTPNMSTRYYTDEKKFNPRKSHWLTYLSFIGTKWEVPWDYSGVNKNFSPKSQDMYGGRFGWGGEIYLGAGFNTTTKLEGYYAGSLFTSSTTADPTYDIEYSYSKNTGSLWGVDVAQAIGFLFDMKTKNPMMDQMTYLTVEPYIEVGIGFANAWNRVHYFYDTTGPDPGGTEEEYRHTVSDKVANARIGAGINFTSTKGFFLYLNATQNRYDITKREESIYNMPAGGGGGTTTKTTSKDVKIDPVFVYSIGGGYKF